MNERIMELATQAGLYNDWNGKPWPTAMSCEECTAAYEKFSKLILQECIRCCEQVISDPVAASVDTWLNGGEQCIQEIKEHFGIEE